MAQPKEIFVRLDRCLGCHSCELACSVEHSQSKSLYSAISEKPTPQSRVYVEWVAPDNRLPVLCRHCEDAPCMHACICGAISRTDLLMALHEDIRKKPKTLHDFGKEDEYLFSKNLRNLMEERIPTPVIKILRQIGEEADALGFSAYVVGGFVRDLLLGIENLV